MARRDLAPMTLDELNTPANRPATQQRKRRLSNNYDLGPMSQEELSRPDPVQATTNRRATSLGQRTSTMAPMTLEQLSGRPAPMTLEELNAPDPIQENARQQNLQKQASSAAAGRSLSQIKQSEEYKRASGTLDALRKKHGADKNSLFQDPEYQAATTQMAQILRPVEQSRASVNQTFANQQSGYNQAKLEEAAPGFAQDANQRQNDLTQSQVGVAGSVRELNNSNAGLIDAQTGQVAPNAESQRGLVGAQTGLVGAQAEDLKTGTGRMIQDLRTQNQTLSKNHSELQQEVARQRTAYQNLLKMYQEMLVKTGGGGDGLQDPKGTGGTAGGGAGANITPNALGMAAGIGAAKQGNAPGAAAPQQKPGPVTQPTRITSVDDYNKLPSGAVYIDPNGQAKRKR